MKKATKKSVIIVFMLSLLLLNIPNTRAATWLDEGQEAQSSKNDTAIETIQGGLFANINSDCFWQLVKERLGGKRLPNLEDKEVILLLGQTGVWKSTFVNRLLGHEFNWEYEEIEETQEQETAWFTIKNDNDKRGERKLVMAKKNPNAPIADIGNGAASCTTTPQVYILQPENLALIDCPGFGDTKGAAQEILNFLMIRLLIQKAKAVKAIIGMIPYSALTDGGRGVHFLYLAKQLNYLVKFEACLPNVVWGITRCPEGISCKAIIRKIEAIKKEKVKTFKTSQLFSNEGEKMCKNKILLEKLLENKANIFPLSPLYDQKAITELKIALKGTERIKKPIDKAYFDFHHPTLDVKGIIRAIFSKPEKLKLINSYKIHKEIIRIEAESRQKLVENKAIMDNKPRLRYYIKNAIADKEAQLKQAEQDWKNAEKEAEALQKNVDELTCYRTKHISLHARYLNDHKTITYDDFPFDACTLEESYDQDKVKKLSKDCDPAAGVYKAEFTVSGTFINWLHNSATNANVTVKFYVKNKYVQEELRAQKKQEAKQKNDDYVTKVGDLALAKKDIEAYLKTQTQEILPQQIQKLQSKKKQLEKELEGELNCIYFIGEVYPFLYPNVDDYFNHFAKAYKHTFKLFAKDDKTATYDYTLQNYPYQVKPIQEKAHLDIKKMPAALDAIRNAISTHAQSHAHLPQLLAMVTYDRTTKHYCKYLFASNGFLADSLAQQKAHEYNYHLIKSPSKPVLWQVISFLAQTPELVLEHCVLRKEANLCLACGHMATHLLGQSLLMKKGGCQEQACAKMVATTEVAHAFYSSRFSDKQRQTTINAVGDIFFKNNILSYNNEDNQKKEHKAAAVSLPLDQLLIPANGQCLYTAVIIGYLLPVREAADEVTARIDQLFGLQPAYYLNELHQTLQNLTHYLTYLQSDAFGTLVTAFMTRMQIKKGTWGGPQEIQTIADKLQVNIQAYYPDPSNLTNLVQSDLTKPSEAIADITLHIVRDKVHPAEVLTQAEKASAVDNPHYQHYRLKYTLPASVSMPVLPSTQPPLADKIGSPQKNQPYLVEWFKAAETGNRKLLEELYGYIALLRSDVYEQLDCVKYLGEQSTDINTKNENGDTALLLSAQKGHLDCVKFLAQQGADINAKNKNENTAALLSAFNGNLACLKFLLEQGADINTKNKNENTALIWSARFGNLDCVKFLVQQGANVTLKGAQHKTALQWAIKRGKQDVADYLSNLAKQGQLDQAVLEKWFKAARISNRQLLEELYNNYNINVNTKNKYQSTALIFSAYKGDLDCVKFLCQQGADIHARDEQGYTAMLYSALSGHLDCVEFLLQQGAKMNTKDKYKNTALLLSTYQGHLNCVKFLVQKGADINIRNTQRDTALLVSVYRGYVDCVKYLVQQGANIALKGGEDKTALEWAEARGQEAIVNFLSNLPKKEQPNRDVLQQWFEGAKAGNTKLLAALYNNYNINIDSRNESNYTALLLSAKEGQLDCVKFLVQQGADIDTTDKWSSTALLLSAQQGHIDCVQYLLQQGADINTKAKDGGTALLLSAKEGHIDCVKYLLQQGADINTKANDGGTALLWSAYRGHIDCVKYLLQQGADINAKNEKGDTAALVSIYKGQLDCLKYLLQQGADINTRARDGDTALLLSAQRGQVDCLTFLVQQEGADIHARDRYEYTALIWSAQEGYIDCVKYLLQQGADINTRDKWGSTALLRSAGKGHIDCVKYLVQQGANVTFKGQENKTALEWAVAKGQEDVVNYLSNLAKKAQPDKVVLQKWFEVAKTGNTKLLAALYNNYNIN
ncbi:MAG: ankyrin repeat domain-containing protein, partial [Bacteroidota bacterium]